MNSEKVDWIADQNRAGCGAPDLPGGEHGWLSCNGHARAIVDVEFDTGVSAADDPPCGYVTKTVGQIEYFPREGEGGRWHGTGAMLRRSFTPEQLIQFSDRWVCTDDDDPTVARPERTLAVLDIARQHTSRETYMPLTWPPLWRWPAGVRDWLDLCTELYRPRDAPNCFIARRPCTLILDFALNGPSVPLLRFAEPVLTHLRTDGPLAAGRHVLHLDEGEAFLLGSTRNGWEPGVVSGRITLDVGPTDMDARPLEQRLAAERTSVTLDEAVQGLQASAGRNLEPVTGPLPDAPRGLLGLAGGVRSEAYARVVYGAGERVTALPRGLWAELLERSQIDREHYDEDGKNCVWFSIALRNELWEWWGVTGVHVVIDSASLHAYVALLVAEPDGGLSWMFIEPQSDREAPPGAVHYRMTSGWAWLSTEPADTPAEERTARGFVWLAADALTIATHEQFTGADIRAGTPADLGLTGQPLPADAVEVPGSRTDWGACWWVY